MAPDPSNQSDVICDICGIYSYIMYSFLLYAIYAASLMHAKCVVSHV